MSSPISAVEAAKGEQEGPTKNNGEENGKDFLTTLDDSKVSLFHFKTIVIAGMGFFADAYDLFSIGLLTKLLGRIYYQDYTKGASPGKLPIGSNAAVSALALVGTLVGQLVFGYLGDKLGRKHAYGVTLLLMIFFAIMSGMTFGPTTQPTAVIGTLCFMRFWLGVGVGGDYPLSATIMSEYSNRENRGAFIAAVFSMQGIGILCAAAVSVIVTLIFKGADPGGPYDKSSVEGIRRSVSDSADYVWRIQLAFGAIPAMLTLHARAMMPETSRFTLRVEGDAVKATQDAAAYSGQEITKCVAPPSAPPMSFRRFLREWWRPLLGCCGSWFFLDIAFYSQNLFQKDVFSAIGWIPPASHMNALEEHFRVARAQAIIALGSTIPGYYFTVFTVDRWGRKTIQIMGFFMMTLFMLVLAADYDNLMRRHVKTFVTLYALTFFFSNFGPNATTFIIPAELFPTAWRSTAHGLAAASGKAGAIVGAFGFLYASQPNNAKAAAPYPPGIGMRASLAVMAAINFCGLLCTFLIPETLGRSLEELNLEASSTSSENGSDIACVACGDISKEVTGMRRLLFGPTGREPWARPAQQRDAVLGDMI